MPRMASSAASPSDSPRRARRGDQILVRALQMRDAFDVGAAKDVGQGRDGVAVRVRLAAFGCLQDGPRLRPAPWSRSTTAHGMAPPARTATTSRSPLSCDASSPPIAGVAAFPRRAFDPRARSSPSHRRRVDVGVAGRLARHRDADLVLERLRRGPSQMRLRAAVQTRSVGLNPRAFNRRGRKGLEGLDATIGDARRARSRIDRA